MLLRIVREHWHIENRRHYVRDWTCDEDRCRAHVRHTPRNLAGLSNAAISIVRFEGPVSIHAPGQSLLRGRGAGRDRRHSNAPEALLSGLEAEPY